MKRLSALDFVAFGICAIAAFGASYEYARADACGCSKKCYQFTGQANKITLGINCNMWVPYQAFTTDWCTNADCTGGNRITDGAITTFKNCDSNSCQMYCVPCAVADDMESDPTMTGCNTGVTDDRYRCETGG